MAEVVAIEAINGFKSQEDTIKKVDEDEDEDDETTATIKQISNSRWGDMLNQVNVMLEVPEIE